MQKNLEPPSYNYSIKLEDSLREPVRRLAFNTNKQIREVVSEATRAYLEKQKNKIKAVEL
jgi:predicted transcriptional regulator